MADLADKLEDLVRCAAKKGADQAEAFGQESAEKEIWFENNRIKTVKSQPSEGIGLRVIKNKRFGFASVNSIDEHNFDELCKRALSLASANLADRFQLIPEPGRTAGIKGLFDLKISELTLKRTISMARVLLNIARDYDKRVTVDSGGVFTSTGQKALVNSEGIELFEKSTDLTALIMGMAREGEEVSAFDFRFEGSRRLGKIKLEQMAKEFAKNVVRSLGARPARSFTGTVLFSPHALAETLIGPVIYAANSKNVQKGMSRLADSLGKKIFSAKLSLADDGLLKDGLSTSAFDREGQPHLRLDIVRKGKLSSFLYNTRTARKEGRKTTGHASGSYRSVPGIGPTNLVIAPGQATKAQLVKDIKEGILVTRFSGNSNPISGDFSGTVKGGFYIKNGRLSHPVTNTMIAGNVFDALANVTGLSKKLSKVFSFLLPYIAIKGISVTSG